MIAWRCIYGRWLVTPISHTAENWFSPALHDILFSYDRSLFYWTPITFLACLGFVLIAVRQRRFLAARFNRLEPFVLLFAAFIVQVYALAALWGQGAFDLDLGTYRGAYLSQAFGMRHLTESIVVLAPGLALLLERMSRRWFLLLASVGLVMVLWNLLLIYQYNLGLLPPDARVAPGPLLLSTLRLIQEEPGATILAFEALALFGFMHIWRQLDRPAGDLSDEETLTASPPRLDPALVGHVTWSSPTRITRPAGYAPHDEPATP
jgi:hypothetical protein